MSTQPIDQAATPDETDAPEIAADDAGASALAEKAGKAGQPHQGEDGEGV